MKEKYTGDKRYSCILFDMDGTLVDSYEGIFHAYEWSLKQMGREFGGEAFVRRAIGAPLLWAFESLCGMERAEAERAAAEYRAYYARKGKRQVRVYAGMKEALRQLREGGLFLAAATLKKEGFAREILEEQGLLPYFGAVCGMDENDSLTKADLIRRGTQAAGCKREETILVGDSAFDAHGANEAGIPLLAVTYGFGFRSRKQAEESGAALVAETAGEIPALLGVKRPEEET